MSATTRSSLALLAGTGFASAIICLVAPSGGHAFLLPGAIFGIMIVAYFWLFERYIAPLRFLTFLCACSASYPLSMMGALGVGLLFRPFADSSSQSTGVPLIYLFVGGGVGACIVLLSGMLLFGPVVTLNRKASGATFLCTIGGCLLGLLGGAIDRHLWPGHNSGQVGVFVLWQTGVALMLGLLLRQFRRSTISAAQTSPSDSEPATHRVGVAGVLFLACVVAGFSFLVWKELEAVLREKHRAAMIVQLKAEEPSRARLEPPEALTNEQLFVLHDIGALRPLYPQVNSTTTWRTSAPTLQVASVGYGLEQPRSMPSLRRKALVQLLRLPNIEWARYEDHYIVTHEATDCDRCVSQVTKFGSPITRIQVQEGAVAYVWSSGNTLISITDEELLPAEFMTPQIASGQEEVLRLYLEKYPEDKK